VVFLPTTALNFTKKEIEHLNFFRLWIYRFFLNGDIGEIIQKLQLAENAERMKNAGNV
jgi:hypothetical protein